MNMYEAFFGSCRSRSYSEIDPNRGNHFIGFWAPDLRGSQGFQRDVPVDKWKPHPESSNMERLVIESEKGKGARTIGSIAAFFGENKMELDSSCPVLSFSSPGQRQLYVRIRVYVEGIDCVLFKTSFSGGPGFNLEVSMVDRGIVAKAHGAEWVEGAEPVTLTASRKDFWAWSWIKVFVDLDTGKFTLSGISDPMEEAITIEADLPGGLYKAPDSAKHSLGWDGENARPGGDRVSLMDFGYGSSIGGRPPTPDK